MTRYHGALLLATGALAFGMAACGSGDDSIGDRDDTTGEQSRNFKPDRQAPASAGDRRDKAPDDVISERPGGSGSPARP